MTNKYILAIALFLSVHFNSNAEYNGIHIELMIKMENGDKLHAYNFIAPYFLNDTLEAYLEKNPDLILRNDLNDSLGNYAFCKERVEYNFILNGGYGKSYQLIHKTSIDFNSIQSVAIISAVNYSYAVGMSGINTLNDTVWSNIPAKEKYNFGGLFCSHDIFIHEQNKNVKLVISQLEKASLDFDTKLKALEEELEISNGADYYNTKEKMDTLEEKSGEVIDNIIEGFDEDSKVIILTMCTC